MTKRIERVEPIKPKDIIDNLDDIIHPAIIKAVNFLLKEQFRGGSTAIKQKDIEAKAMEFCSDLTSKEIYDKKHMNFEKVFEKAGWIVKYAKPDWDENYDAYFKFEAKK